MGYDWWKFYCKNAENFLSTMQKNSLENSLQLPRNRKKKTLLSYNVNDRMFAQSKSIKLCTNRVNIEFYGFWYWVRRIYLGLL